MKSCLVCGVNIGIRGLITGNIQSAELCTLEDGMKAHKLLEELSKTNLKPNDLKDKCFCRKCYKKCQDYNDMQKNLKTLENDILTSFRTANVSKTNTSNTKILNKNKMVFITADTTIRPIKNNQEKTIILSNHNRSLLKRPAVANVASNEIEESSIASTEQFQRNVASIKKSVMTIDINRLPREFMERFASKHHVIVDKSNFDEHSEIKSEVIQPHSETIYSTIMSDKDTFEENAAEGYTEQKTEQDDEMETEYLLGDVELLEDDGEDDDESETILMSDSGLIQMVKGGANKFITLLNDNQDSNDDSHIELQVSGDEATANAIIAAAKQQGCTYIKVDADDMIRMNQSGSEPDDDPLADDSFTVPEELKEMLTYNNKEYHCQLCKNREEPAEFSTSEASQMTDHMTTEHSSKVYICTQCRFVASRRSEFTQHMLTDHDDKILSPNQKKFKCSECDMRLSSKFLLEQHSLVHTGSRPFQCNICEKTFASKYILQSHFKIHSDRERPYNCPLCQKSFYTINNLSQHEKTHTAKRDFKCTTCGKHFLTRHNLEIHSVVHSKVKPFICGVCDKAFARKPEIRDHMRTHTGERPFQCPQCPAKFSQRSNLHSHTRNTHTQERRHACDLCERRFKRRRLLEYHKRAVHTGERPYKCATCAATFVYPDHLKKHTLLHTAERSWGCEICGKKFNSKDNRNTHRFTHSDKKPYECLVCGAGFMRKSLLYTHMTTSGHITESIVVNQPRVSQITDEADVPLAETDETINEAVPEDIPTIVHENKYVATGPDDGNTLYITQELLPTQVVSEEMATIVHKNEYVATGPDDENMLYITQGDENTGAFCLPSTDVQKFVTNDDGSFVRLVKVKLPGGGEGWIALEEISE